MMGDANRRRGREEGSGTVGSILALVFGGGLLLIVIILFATGLAQNEIAARLRLSMNRAAEQVSRTVKRVGTADKAEETAEAASADSAQAAAPAADSLEAVRTQIETQKAFLEEQQRSLEQLRGSVDSLVTRYEDGRNKELARQAKLLAGMKPEEAARILEQMDDATVSVLLSKLNPRVASRVLPRLDAARVARLTTEAIGIGEAEAVLAASDGPNASPDGTQ